MWAVAQQWSAVQLWENNKWKCFHRCAKLKVLAMRKIERNEETVLQLWIVEDSN